MPIRNLFFVLLQIILLVVQLISRVQELETQARSSGKKKSTVTPNKELKLQQERMIEELEGLLQGSRAKVKSLESRMQAEELASAKSPAKTPAQPNAKPAANPSAAPGASVSKAVNALLFDN